MSATGVSPVCRFEKSSSQPCLANICHGDDFRLTRVSIVKSTTKFSRQTGRSVLTQKSNSHKNPSHLAVTGILRSTTHRRVHFSRTANSPSSIPFLLGICPCFDPCVSRLRLAECWHCFASRRPQRPSCIPVTTPANNVFSRSPKPATDRKSVV